MKEELLDITYLLAKLDALSPETKPLWGSMNAQRMVEHLSESIQIASGKTKFKLEVPETQIERMQAFLASDKPLPKNVEVSFAPANQALRHDEIALAIDEFLLEWIDFEEHFQSDEQTELHPYYGPLNFAQWQRLHQKHIQHHFEQFGLI